MKWKLRERRQNQATAIGPPLLRPRAATLPAEGVEDQRVVGVFGVSVSGGETQGAKAQVVTGDPMMHHGQARVK